MRASSNGEVHRGMSQLHVGDLTALVGCTWGSYSCSRGALRDLNSSRWGASGDRTAPGGVGEWLEGGMRIVTVRVVGLVHCNCGGSLEAPAPAPAPSSGSRPAGTPRDGSLHSTVLYIHTRNTYIHTVYAQAPPLRDSQSQKTGEDRPVARTGPVSGSGEAAPGLQT